MSRKATLLYRHEFTKTGRVSDGTDALKHFGKIRFDGPMEARGLVYKNYQYASYYESNGDIVIERRNLDNPDAWEKSTLQGYRMNSQDRHCKISMKISGDGVIHLAFDHHTSPEINYAKTEVGAANNPEKVTWDNEVFSLLPNLGLDVFMGSVTYPSFISIGSGNMLIYWRIGSASSGEMNLGHYDSNTHEWSFIGLISSKYGVYKGIKGTRGPYHAGFQLDSKGNIHLAWLWREFPQKDSKYIFGNHGLFYAYSEDGGFTWLDNDGKKVADTLQGEKISIDNVDKVVNIPIEMEPSNSSHSSAVDPKTGEFHEMLRHYKSGTNKNALHHYIRSSDGEWAVRVVDDFDSERISIFFADDLLYALLDSCIYVSFRGKSFNDWERIDLPDVLLNRISCYDMSRIKEGIISVFSQKKPAKRGEPTLVEVFDFLLAP